VKFAASASLCVLGILAVTGCGKSLTESSAVKLVQRNLDLEAGGIVSTQINALTSQIGVALAEPSRLAAIERLLKEGYLQQKAVAVVLPNISGTFIRTKATIHLNGLDHTFQESFELHMTTERPPVIEGSFRQCEVETSSCDIWSIKGVSQSKSADLTLSPESSSHGANIPAKSMTVSLVRGQPDELLYEANSRGIVIGDAQLRAIGHATEPDIQQQWFIYGWTRKLPKDALNGPLLKLGHLVTDSCDNLVLVSETAATAVCKTHLKLTKDAEIIFGNRATNIPLLALFRKKPDGTWSATHSEYRLPAFAIGSTT
jgi:hypothetical protein